MELTQEEVLCPKKKVMVRTADRIAHCGDAWLFKCKRKTFWYCTYGRFVDVDAVAAQYGGGIEEDEENEDKEEEE